MIQLFKPRDSADELEDILDRERVAILAGRYDILSRILADKERLTTPPPQIGSSRRLRILRGKADRNHALLLAAASGVRSAVRSLKSATGDQNNLATYDTSGNRALHRSGPSSLERKV